MEENEARIKELGLRQMATGLNPTKPTKKKKVIEEFSDLELPFDRDYVSGHDSLSEDEEEHFYCKVYTIN